MQSALRTLTLLTILVCSTLPVDGFAQQNRDPQARPSSPTQLEAPTPQTATGIVKNFTPAPAGESDGFELDDGTTVHYPPSLHRQVAAVISKNDRVRIVGLVAPGSGTGPKPVKLLEAQTIINLTTNRTLDLEKLLLEPPNPTPAPALPR